uniref:golgin subfamily A member 6-like protein 6 n=1 Tax=Osmia lignaria TaxID=473952 RepID=UPI0014791AFE|nr:golgin subfamily A member 6-like protein 6 [Osmia lignaria]
MRRGEGSKWEEERRKFFEERGLKLEKLEEKRSSGEMGYEELEERDKQMQEEERWEKITESRYNRWYKTIIEPGIPRYLEKGWKEERWRRVAKFRLGNEVKEAKYWEKEEERKCRLCGWEEETWEHIWERCAVGGEERKEEWQERVREMLGGSGEGEDWMKQLEKYRTGTGEGQETRSEKRREV